MFRLLNLVTSVPRLLFTLFLTCSSTLAELSFNEDILPILSDNCFTCHGPDANTREAELRLDLEEEARAVLDPKKSELLARVHSTDPDEIMPPPDSRRTLTDDEKSKLEQWINEGAKWETHWAFVKPVKPEKPPLSVTTHHDWAKNPIDHFIAAELERHEFSPSPDAAKHKLIRRVYLDLTGLPPTPEEVDAFLADERPDAYEQLVDRLLASPRYGETMALPWLEAARFSDTDGYQYDGPRSMWRWRDWVIEAYNENKPFDEFTIEQLAGDLLTNPTVEHRIATGFNRNHRYNSEAGAVPEEFLLENAVDRVDTTSTVWLGLTVGCARCHDHKYDPISQKDYYQLIAFFNNIPEFGRAVKHGNSEPYIPAPTKEQQVQLADLDQKITASKNALNTPALQQAQRDWENTLQNESTALPARDLNFHAPLNALPSDAKVLSGKPQFSDGLHFDGQTVVTLPNSALDPKKEKSPKRFDAITPSKKFSFSFWIKPDSVKEGTIISRQAKTDRDVGFNLEFRDGHLVYSLITRWIAGAGMIETKEKFPLNKWTHVTLTHHGQLRATNQHVFFNGKEVPVKIIHNTNSNPIKAQPKEPLRLGGFYEKKFQGALRDLRFYQRPLDPTEITALSEPASLTEITALTPADRSPSQATKLRLAFLEQGPGKTAYDAYLSTRKKRDQFVAKLPTVMVMKENPLPKKTYLRERGAYNVLGEEVQRDVPSALPPLSADAPRNRLGFARWLVSPDNPLTARVTVNRYWQRYFGTGLVKTSEDFGVQSEKPSHPKLLDWLATEFIRSGWDVKHMQKLIVTSATYRQQSQIPSLLLETDPANRLLARGPRQRLPGHVIRDQALALSGLLSEKIGGPSVSPYQPKNLWIEMSMGMKYKPSKGNDLFRRSLYTIWKRTVNPPSMAILDSADREACWVGVKRTNTPLQALLLLNETTFIESARKLAERLILEKEKDPVTHGFRIVTQRNPSPDEEKILTKALTDYRAKFKADTESAKKLLTIGESAKAKNLDPIEHAALTALANVLLNLDEVITKE